MNSKQYAIAELSGFVSPAAAYLEHRRYDGVLSQKNVIFVDFRLKQKEKKRTITAYAPC